jgi:hypothetical protein
MGFAGKVLVAVLKWGVTCKITMRLKLAEVIPNYCK